MALTCPRCGTDVPSEAQYCPYCSLPKPKRGFTAASEEKLEETAPADPANPLVAPRHQATAGRAAKAQPKSANRSAKRPGKPPRKLRLSVLSIAAIVAVLSVGIYIFVVPMVYSEQAEPKTVLSALDKLRKTPSNDPSLTIDACLQRELDTSRRVGNLVSYQGWTIRPVKGTKSKVVLAFSYKEAGDVHQSAEWIADLSSNIFTPQTDLAAAIYGKE